MGDLFGTDGIRGEANTPPMTPDMALKLGRALAANFNRSQRAGRTRIVVGKDTRLSGYILEQALAAGICAMGADVWLCGPLPTPGIAFITTSLRADAGVVISASHNPYYDNGIKIFGHDGFKLPDTVEERLEELILEDSYQQKGVTRDALGKAYRLDEAWARYVVFLKTVLPRELQLDGLKIVVDCAHGAAYKVAPHVFEELGADVVALSCSPNGTNINHECGSLHPEHMCKTVLAEGADMGIALDGDADRVVMCDEKGQVIDGDQLMAISALRMKRDGRLNGDTVVGTVMSNLGLEHVLNDAGIQLLRTDVGDRYVVEAMRKGGYNLGGEQSGHLIFLDQTSTGDGILAAIQTLTVMLRENQKLSELAQVMQRMPQVLVNVQVATKPPIDDIPSVASLIADVEQRLGDTGRVLVRYSGTEAKARVMLEGTDEAAIRGYADEIAGALQTALAS